MSNPEPKEVNMRCVDYPRCDSMTATETVIQQEGAPRMYICTKCKKPKVINVGGHFGAITQL